ncbi:MAG TPA: hypothetical protein VNT23_08380 [Gaiellaceae bacterium]|nr:hypothetical protein [Gaiellaceae bacterium]
MRLRRDLVVSATVAAIVALAVGYALGRGGQAQPVAAGAAPAAAEPAPDPRLARKTFLFAHAAAGGRLEGTGDRLTLTLTGARPWVTRFADRPVRAAQTVDVRDFLRRWKARFGPVPPNAVLSYQVDGEQIPRELVLELRNPRWDADAATMTYDARRITETIDRLVGARHPRRPVVYPLPRSFASASLYIDSASDGDEVDVIVNDVSARNNGLSSTDIRLQWRADLSQCAGYGTSDWRGGLQVYASFQSYSDHSCAFRRTYGRFDVMYADSDGGPLTRGGTITFDSYGFLVSCVGVDCSPYGGINNNRTIDILGGGDGGP